MRRSPVDHARATSGRIASIFPALLLSGLVLCCATHARAQTDNWLGTDTNQWNDSLNWDNGIPNSTSVSVVITNTTNNPVLISGINPTVANLTLTNNTNSLTLSNNQSLTIAGGTGAGSLDIAGTLNLDSAGNNTDLILGGTSGSTITLVTGPAQSPAARSPPPAAGRCTAITARSVG